MADNFRAASTTCGRDRALPGLSTYCGWRLSVYSLEFRETSWANHTRRLTEAWTDQQKSCSFRQCATRPVPADSIGCCFGQDTPRTIECTSALLSTL